MKIYIAGRITDNPISQREFADAERWVQKQHPEAVIINPIILPEGLEYEDYIDICLAMVRACDVLYTIKGWNMSPGAQAEVSLAFALNKEVKPVPKLKEEKTILKEFITRDENGKPVFTCPKCGWRELEMVMDDVTVPLPVAVIEMGDRSGIRPDIQIDEDRACDDGGVLSRFQCHKCGFIIKKDGETVDSEIDLVELLSNGNDKV